MEVKKVTKEVEMVQIDLTISKQLYDDIIAAQEDYKTKHGEKIPFSEFLETAFYDFIMIIERQTSLIQKLQSQNPASIPNNEDIDRSYM